MFENFKYIFSNKTVYNLTCLNYFNDSKNTCVGGVGHTCVGGHSHKYSPEWLMISIVRFAEKQADITKSLMTV